MNDSNWPQPVPYEEENSIENGAKESEEQDQAEFDSNSDLVKNEKETDDSMEAMGDGMSEDKQLLDYEGDLLENSLQGSASPLSESEGDIVDVRNADDASDASGHFVLVS